MSTKILFLEPINVLNSPNFKQKLIKLNNGRISSMYDEEFDPMKVQMLKELLTVTDAKLIICSDWRCCPAKMRIVLDVLSKAKINLGEDILALMSFHEKNLSKSESVTKYLSSMSDRLGITKYATVDSELNPNPINIQSSFFTLNQAEGLTEDLKMFIISYLGLAT